MWMKSYQLFKICKRFDMERKRYSYSSQCKKTNRKKMELVL